MTTRITQIDLEKLVASINRATDSPRTPYHKDDAGQYFANIGNYSLDYAYGGVRLVRIVNQEGGISPVFDSAFGTKRELYAKMSAFLAGLQAGIQARNHD